jgi:hypothetical protein
MTFFPAEEARARHLDTWNGSGLRPLEGEQTKLISSHIEMTQGRHCTDVRRVEVAVVVTAPVKSA